jgi:hypothetical protein
VGQEQTSSSSPSTLVLSLSFTSQNLTPDGLSLLSLKSAVDQMSDVGLAFSNWNENDTTLCGWSGISCMNITGFSQGRMEGGSRSPPKKISSLDFFFQNFWLPSLKNTSWASYFSKELASITHVEALPWFQ